jgi:predicted transcriptional regulator
MSMRTTVEIDDRQRARLHDLAVRRGLRGFSTLVSEAIELYLKQEAGRPAALRAALAVGGTLEAEEADELARATQALREGWR